MKRILIFLLFLLACLLPQAHADNVFRNGDVFEMRLSGPPEEFTREFSVVLTVDEGSVNLPLIGRIPAVGLSSSQLASVIETRLKQAKIFTIANVNITVNTTQNQRTLIVGGAVRVPGRQPWVADLTLTGAIGAAGGFGDFAKDTIKVVRAGKAEVYSRKMIRKDPSRDPKIQPGDYIEVQGDY
jgi:polysaccharide export outer membrane protein